MRNQSDKHLPPAETQPMPADNTSSYVAAQVKTFVTKGQHIHPEIAQEIAAGYATASNAMGRFASTGELDHRAIMSEIAQAIRVEDTLSPGSGRALWALRIYVLESLHQTLMASRDETIPGRLTEAELLDQAEQLLEELDELED